MSCFIFNDYDYYISGVFDSNKKIKEDKKKILISNIFKDVFNLLQNFLDKLIKIYFYFDKKIKDLDRLFNFNENDLKIIKRIDKYFIDIKKINKTYYKRCLNITMKFINNWENFILAIIKDINENIKKYEEEEKVFKKNTDYGSNINNNQQYKIYFINFVIYNIIFSKFEYVLYRQINRNKGYYLDYVESFLTNINALFKFNILSNTDKRIKFLFSYFSCKINKKYEYLIECRKMLYIVKLFYQYIYCEFEFDEEDEEDDEDKHIKNKIEKTYKRINLQCLNEFENITFIFYEFLNLCFVLLEDNIEF